MSGGMSTKGGGKSLKDDKKPDVAATQHGESDQGSCTVMWGYAGLRPTVLAVEIGNGTSRSLSDVEQGIKKRIMGGSSVHLSLSIYLDFWTIVLSRTGTSLWRHFGEDHSTEAAYQHIGYIRRHGFILSHWRDWFFMPQERPTRLNDWRILRMTIMCWI